MIRVGLDSNPTLTLTLIYSPPQVDFYVQLNMSRCLEQTKFHLSVQGISEQLKLVVKMKCECDCGPVEEASPSCSGHGTLHCGTCR